MKRFSGFTLVELLVVLSIISVLAAIGLVNFNSARIKGRDTRRKTDLANIQQGLESYYEDSRSYPVSGNASLSVLVPTYLPAIPSDPKTAAGYTYVSTGAKYVISARLENQSEAVSSTMSFDATSSLCVLTGSTPLTPYVSGVCDQSGSKHFQVSSGG